MTSSSKQLIIYSFFVLGIILIPSKISHASDLPKPVPSFEDVNTVNPEVTATIPDSQKKLWEGNYYIKEQVFIKDVVFPINQYIKQYSNFTTGQLFLTTKYNYNPKEIYLWTKTLSTNIDSQTEEPKLVIKNDKAVEFTPPTVGRILDRYNATLAILDNLNKDNTLNIKLPVIETAPKNSLKDLNDLGIKELIGRGESKFNGSPANRRVNIKVGVSKMKGVIIKPGEEFSFNKYLGPVEAEYGFLPELVIKADKGTIPELGGGLCQVSSTTFRAAMHAGLPITQRRNHSYAVNYYAPQGTDATIYPGVIDLKFKNDTPGSILIWPYFKNNDYLVFDFYGTRDNREVTLGKPSQFDRKSDGSMKALWNRTVIIDGQTRKDNFSSTYLPPALFHKTETFIPNNQTPNTPPTTNPTTPTTPENTPITPNNQTHTNSSI